MPTRSVSAGDWTAWPSRRSRQRADVTRRTFYSHYRDIPDLVERSEAELLRELAGHIERISQARLGELYTNIAQLEPCPGSVELLEFIRDNSGYMSAMLGPGGDPAFIEKSRPSRARR